MPPEETLEAAADEILRAHCGKPLTDIQRMILRESLAGKVYEQMEGYTTQHIKNEGKDLWKLLSETLGEKVSKTNFKGALENWQKAREVAKMPPDPRAYEPDTWVGRSTIIDELLSKLQNKTRLVWITGISGIGKTTLGECLACRAWKTNPTFRWEHLEVSESQGADFTTVAADLLAKLGDRELDPQERNDPKRLTDRLIRKLQSSAYWVQLDSLERLLNTEQGTEFADAHWVTFLQRCLTERDFASRLVLTAQALPSALVVFADRYPNVWAAKTLAGLSANEPQNEHLEFFRKHGVAVDEENQAILGKLGQVYEGHTLVLQVMSGEIQADFAGDAVRYWAVNQQEFEQVARSLDAKRLDETEYNDELDRRVRDRVKQSLQQLPTDAQDLLLRSSVYRRPVPKKFWLAMIDDRSSSRQKEAYRVLCDRALVEKDATDIRQHNLIRAIAYDLLKGDTSIIWEIAERHAACLWMTAYTPALNASNLEIVRGYLEAFDHSCEIQDWEIAVQIAWTKLGTPTREPLCMQLRTWSYFQIAILFNLKLLSIAQKTQNCKNESIALGDLGLAYDGLGQYQQAVDCHQQALVISRKIGDLSGEGYDLGNLGMAHYGLGQSEKALYFHQQSLAIARKIDDCEIERNALGNRGLVYDSLGQYELAIDGYQQALVISRKLCCRLGEGSSLLNIAATSLKLKKYEEALINNQAALEIFQEIGDRASEAEALKNSAELYQALGEVEVAQQYCQQALALATEWGIPLAVECRKLQKEIENCTSVSSG